MDRKINKKQNGKVLADQRGIAALLLVLMLFIVGMGIFLRTGGLGLEPPGPLTQQAATTGALAQARDLVIAFAALNSPPGGLPFPDRHADGNYDGHGDCVTHGFDPSIHLLGRWPYLAEQGCGPDRPAFGMPLRDGSAEILWYAVSRHLVRSEPGGSFPVIDANLLTDPNANWFSVFDAQGNLLSDRVAVLIMAAGPPLVPQDRSGAAPAPHHFLDEISIDHTIHTNHRIETGDTGFVTHPPYAPYPSPLNMVAFNDRLLYITIDELMSAIAPPSAQDPKALILVVVGEMQRILDGFYDDRGRFPRNQDAFEDYIEEATDRGLLAAWVEEEWLPRTTYTTNRPVRNQATLTFEGCAITFTLSRHPGEARSRLTLSQNSC